MLCFRSIVIPVLHMFINLQNSRGTCLFFQMNLSILPAQFYPIDFVDLHCTLLCLQVVEIVKRAVPSVLEPENDTRLKEWKKLKAQKEKIDMLAHKQVRQILWSGLGVFVVQMGLFFRLTFWEFSWDVMEPIAFFTTSTGLVVGYAYFIITSRDPTYQDFMKRLFLSRQKKLCQKENFDMDRYLELQKHCHCSLLDIGTPHEVEYIYKD